MKTNTILVSLVAILAIVISTITNVSAFGTISSVEVSGVEGISSNVAAFAGDVLPVRVVFHATNDASDVRVKAWIAGDRDYAVSSDRFDVIAGRTYSRLISINVPENIDPSEELRLNVLVENKQGTADSEIVIITGQRESYALDILDVSFAPTVMAGTPFVLDIVLRNMGAHFAEDTFVEASIPALGISQRAFFGDLTSVDNENDSDDEDAVERSMSLNIPLSASSGVYTLEIEATNADSVVTVSKKFAIGGASEDTIVAIPSASKTFAAGETAVYSITLVNTGNKVRVYELGLEALGGLNLNVDEPLVVIPAGSSKTVKVDASASKEGTYTFAVNINSANELIKKVELTSNVEGTKVFAGNAAVLLTVVLAVIFVVLLIVLIVLLTRKPEKTEEFGESYY